MTTVAAQPAPLHPSVRRLGLRRLLAVNAFWFGNGAHWQPIFVALIPVGATLVDPVNKDILVGKVTAAGGVFALLVPIGVGWLSDRTASRWGRRRPWMVVGTALNVVGLLLLSVAGTVYLLIGFYLLLQASNNMAGAAYSGVIPDVVPEAERGRASGLLGVMNGVGTVFGLLGVLIIFAFLHDTRGGVILGYCFVAVVLSVSLTVTCVGTHEQPSLRSAPRGPLRVTRAAAFFGICFSAFVIAALWLLIEQQLRLPVVGAVVVTGLAALLSGLRLPALQTFVQPFRHHDFFWVFATRFLVQFGIFSIVPFIDFYFRDVVGAGNRSGAESSLWLLFVIGAGIAPALVCGAISDRTHRRKVFVYLAGGIQAAVVSVLVFGLVTSLPLLYLLGMLYGVGYGTYYAVDWALACDVLPDRGAEAGKDMALWHISFTLPQVLAPAILGGVLHYLDTGGHSVAGLATGSNLGFRFVFGTAAIWFIVGTVMVSRIRGVA